MQLQVCTAGQHKTGICNIQELDNKRFVRHYGLKIMCHQFRAINFNQAL